MKVTHCQGYVPTEMLNDYWNLNDYEKAEAFDYFMRSTESNKTNFPEAKIEDTKLYTVFTENGEQWDNYLTLEEAKRCLLDEEEINEGKLSYQEMLPEDIKLEFLKG
jgi:hypothetical protein